jgi:hypothetical protein
MLFVSFTAAFAVGPSEDCAWTFVQSSTVITTEPDGTTTTWVHIYYVYSCNITVDGSQPPGGGDPGVPPPPPNDAFLRIRSISDANPTAPVLNIESSGITSIDLYLNGAYTNTYSGSTSFIILPSLHSFTDYSNAIALEGHSDGGPVDAVAEMTRGGDVRRGSSVLIIHWVMESEGLTPITEDLSYYRTVDDLVTYTSYSIPTEGQRNGRVEQHRAEDTVHAATDEGAFGFVSTFRISSLRALNEWDEGLCWLNFADGHHWHASHCTNDIDEFVFDGSSASSTLSSPGRINMLGCSITQGDEITITP